MTAAAASYNLGDISSMLFNANTAAAPPSKKSKSSSSSSAPSNPFAVTATAAHSPFAEAARAQVVVAARLQAEGSRRKDKKSKKDKAGESNEETHPSSSSAPAAQPIAADSAKTKENKKQSAAAPLTSSAAATAAAHAASHAAAAFPVPSSSGTVSNSTTTTSAPKAAAATAPVNGVVNGIVYKDGQRVTRTDISPRLPPGERVTDPDKDARTVFVGNVPVSIKLKHIKRHFTPCGTVESVRLRSLPVATPKLSRKGAYATKDFREGASSCNAYVVFADVSSVPAALKLNGSELGGHHVRVDSAGGKGGAAQKFNNRLSLFVGNLDYRVNEEALHAHFSAAAGEGVVAVRCIRDKATSFGKGFAYVHFSTVDALTAALKLDGKPFETRPLRVSRSDGKASLKRSRTDESSKPAARPKGATAAAAKPHVAQQRAPTASPVASAAAGEASPGKKLKKPRHVPRPGATQPTLPVRSPAESPRPAAAAPKLRANKVPAHYMRLCVLMQVRLTRLLQAKQGALAGIKKKKSQTGKNRDRCVRVLRVARVRVGHSEFAGATRSLRLLPKKNRRPPRNKFALQHFRVCVQNGFYRRSRRVAHMWLWHAATLEVCGVEEKVRVYH